MKELGVKNFNQRISPQVKLHLSEMLLDLKFHGDEDRFRKTHAFSQDIEAAHAILFNPRYDKWKKLEAYRKWVVNGQPCLFGKAAARTESVFICILEEHEVLRMKRGDEDLRDTIQDHRQTWKRYALEGSHLPSVFFSKERDQKHIQEYDDLSLRYIYDPVGDPTGIIKN